MGIPSAYLITSWKRVYDPRTRFLHLLKLQSLFCYLLLFIDLELFCHYLLRMKYSLLLFLHQLKISLLNFGEGNRLDNMWLYLFERNSMDRKFFEALILRLFIFPALIKLFQSPLRHKTKHWRQLFTLRLEYLRISNIKRMSWQSHKFLLYLW